VNTDNPTTRQRLVRANAERRSLECGGESRFRSIEEADAEIAGLRQQQESEDQAERRARREQAYAELVQASVEKDVLWQRWRQARDRYEKLAREVSTLDFQLERVGVSA
jgi:hypothetical protein